jgi:hypothetical protein
MSRNGHPGERPHELRLIVEPGSEPIAGSLRCGDGPQLPFAGWLDLAAAIDRFTRTICNDEADADTP